jgi:hypothetical protein
MALVGFILTTASAHAGGSDSPYYNYTDALHEDCKRWEINHAGLGICEIVEVEPLTKEKALKRNLSYRAISWGKRFPADEDGYYIATSDEFIPQSWALQSHDGRFHRCTYPVNERWTGTDWIVVPHEGTRDGKPPTRCFWAPEK